MNLAPMKTLMTMTLLLGATNSWGCPTTNPGCACTTNMPSNRLIDDFTTGQGLLYNTAVSGWSTKWQLGDPLHVVGGERAIQAYVGPNSFSQRMEVDVVNNPDPSLGGGSLVLSTGVRAFFSLNDFYGWDQIKGWVPLGIQFPSPSDCDRVRVTFDSSIAGVNFNVELQTPNGTLYQAGTNMGPSPSNGPSFCVDFPFTQFVKPGVTPPFAAQGIDGISLLLQSGSYFGADNFAISKVEFGDQALAAVQPCIYH
jgi:hypothetical protein